LRDYTVLGASVDIDAYMDRLLVELKRVDLGEVRHLANLIYKVWQDGKTVFIFGNGGSACSASHLCEDLGKGCIANLDDDKMRRLKVMSLTDNVGWITALGNDCGYDQIFVQQMMNFAQPGDLAIAISGSGNSPNVLTAVEWANRHGLTTFGITGFNGGKLKGLQHAGLHVPLDDMGMVESVHNCVMHWVIDDLYGRFNRLGRYKG
jgi:D-sedoheptulose 7-phosphate isomerase